MTSGTCKREDVRNKGLAKELTTSPSVFQQKGIRSFITLEEESKSYLVEVKKKKKKPPKRLRILKSKRTDY